MRCATAALLTACILPYIVGSVPFAPRDGLLQRNRRRAIDYPLSSEEAHRADYNDHRRRRRGLPYSVVQVDGSSPTNQGGGAAGLPVTSTVIQTVTASVAPHVSTEVVEITSIVQQSQSPVTVIVTTTIKHGPLPENTATASNQPPAVVEAGGRVQTIVQTVTAAIPSPTTTRYYDNGLWHTSYPVKAFTSSSISTIVGTSSIPIPSSSAVQGDPNPPIVSANRAGLVSSGVPVPIPSSSIQSPPNPSPVQLPNNWNLTHTETYGLRRRLLS